MNAPKTPSRRSMFGLLGLLLVSRTARAAGESVREPTLLSTAEMLGKKLRVLRPNQPATMDYSAERVNIEVDDTNHIRNIFIG